MFALALQAASEGLTLAEVIADVPRDFGALAVYLMFVLFGFFTWYGSKPRTIERYRAPHAADQAGDDAAQPDPSSPAAPSAPVAVKPPLYSERKRRKIRAADPARIHWIG